MTDRRTFLCEDFEISYEDTKKGWSMPYSHHHTNYEIYILLSGERLVTIGDITYRVKAGMASLFESNISHRSVGDTDYTGICIHFSKVYLEKYFLPAVVSSYLTCFKAPIIFIPEDYRQKLVDWNAASCCKSPTAYLLLAQMNMAGGFVLQMVLIRRRGKQISPKRLMHGNLLMADGGHLTKTVI